MAGERARAKEVADIVCRSIGVRPDRLQRHRPLVFLAAAVPALAVVVAGRRRRRRRAADRGGGAGDLEMGAAAPVADVVEQRQPVLHHRLDQPDLDSEASERDLIEQAQPITDESSFGARAADPEAPEADVLEQATAVADDEPHR